MDKETKSITIVSNEYAQGKNEVLRPKVKRHDEWSKYIKFKNNFSRIWCLLTLGWMEWEHKFHLVKHWRGPLEKESLHPTASEMWNCSRFLQQPDESYQLLLQKTYYFINTEGSWADHRSSCLIVWFHDEEFLSQLSRMETYRNCWFTPLERTLPRPKSVISLFHLVLIFSKAIYFFT